MTLQQILACAVGEDVIMNESNVVDFADDGDKVTCPVLLMYFLFFTTNQRLKCPLIDVFMSGL